VSEERNPELEAVAMCGTDALCIKQEQTIQSLTAQLEEARELLQQAWKREEEVRRDKRDTYQQPCDKSSYQLQLEQALSSTDSASLARYKALERVVKASIEFDEAEIAHDADWHAHGDTSRDTHERLVEARAELRNAVLALREPDGADKEGTK
jgi:hypothetical protein